MWGLVGILVVVAVVSLAVGGPNTSDPLAKTASYRGVDIRVARDGAAWRWTVLFKGFPLATNLSVLELEAAIAARNWVDLVFGAPEEHMVDRPEPTAPQSVGRLTPAEPTDMVDLVAFIFLGFTVLLQVSQLGVEAGVVGSKRQHFRYVVLEGPKVLTSGWAATPADARDKGRAAVIVELHKRGLQSIVPEP